MSDIRPTLEAVRSRLNEFIGAAEPRREDWVILSNLVDAQGRPVEAALNRVVMYLAGIEKEAITGAAPRRSATEAPLVPPSLYIDLYVLIVANFYDANYAEGLGMISRVISFFQQNPTFTRDMLPGLPDQIEHLTWELTNLDPLNQSRVFGMAGVSYLPSAYYRVSVLPFQSGVIAGGS
jgi:hypothetical protein